MFYLSSWINSFKSMSQPPQIATLSNTAVVAALTAIQNGSHVVVKCIHVRDTGRVRTIHGPVAKKNDYWVIMQTATQRFKIPNEDLLIISIEMTQAVADEAAANAAVQAADAAVDVDGELDTQATPPQPSAELTSILATAIRAIEGFSRIATQQAAAQPQPVVPVVTEVQQRQDDISRLMLMSDAFRGQDNPTWRLAPGLLLHRFVPEKFLIVSIPHLLFRENPTTGEMTRVPMRTAVQHYRSILSNCKLQFPNQVAVRIVSKDGKQVDDSSVGVRSQIERAERMFVGMLERLDQTETIALPSSKSDWMIFIDIGVELLELYATLAYSFLRGGAKIATSYSSSIMTTGKFDPVKLWNDMASPVQFRNNAQ